MSTFDPAVLSNDAPEITPVSTTTDAQTDATGDESVQTITLSPGQLNAMVNRYLAKQKKAAKNAVARKAARTARKVNSRSRKGNH